MPSAGDRLHTPARMWVARARIVPVTLIPPNVAEATFATPCATTSILSHAYVLSCRRPLSGEQALDHPQKRERERSQQHVKYG